MSWQYLAQREDASTQQLFVKGTRIKASVLWQESLHSNPNEVAHEFNIDIAAVEEAIVYSEANRELIEKEDRFGQSRLNASKHAKSS